MNTKAEALHQFAHYYLHNIEGTLAQMTDEGAHAYLENDIYVGAANTATEISDAEFIDYLVDHRSSLKT